MGHGGQRGQDFEHRRHASAAAFRIRDVAAGVGFERSRSVLTDMWADFTHLRIQVAFLSVIVRCSVIAAMWEHVMYLPKWLWWDRRVEGHVGVIFFLQIVKCL